MKNFFKFLFTVTFLLGLILTLFIFMVQYGIFPFSEVSFGSIFPDSFSDNGLSFDDAHSRWTSAYEIFSRITFLIFMLSGAFFAIARIIPEKFASTWSQTSKIESYEVTE